MGTKKVLFIDRDGTIIVEPPVTKQVDSIDLLEFLPGAVSALSRIAREGDFELVMVTNQDGLGTQSFPEETFWPAHNKMLTELSDAGVRFAEIYIDRSFAEEGKPTRKPGTAMLTSYLEGAYDMAGSYVIGDRLTDLQLALNLSCQAIFIAPESEPRAALTTMSWDEIADFVLRSK